MERLEQGQRRPQQRFEGEPLCCEERLGELGLFSLEKKRLQADLRAACQCLKGAYEKDGDKLPVATGQGIMVLN